SRNLGLGEARAQQRRVDGAGIDGIAADVVAGARAVDGDGHRVFVDGPLARAVGGEVRRRRADSGAGGDVYDAAAAAGVDRRNGSPAAEENAFDVDRVHAPPVHKARAFGRALDRGSGIVHQDVEPAEGALG